jgi:hypothetical protein
VTEKRSEENGECTLTNYKAKALAGLIFIGLTIQPVMAMAAPQLTMRSEEAGHPRIIKTIRDMEDLEKTLRAAPDDFGGNKEKAIDDLHQAIHSLKKALYYRLHLDDAAIDRAQ